MLSRYVGLFCPGSLTVHGTHKSPMNRNYQEFQSILIEWFDTPEVPTSLLCSRVDSWQTRLFSSTFFMAYIIIEQIDDSDSFMREMTTLCNYQDLSSAVFSCRKNLFVFYCCMKKWGQLVESDFLFSPSRGMKKVIITPVKTFVSPQQPGFLFKHETPETPSVFSIQIQIWPKIRPDLEI